MPGHREHAQCGKEPCLNFLGMVLQYSCILSLDTVLLPAYCGQTGPHPLKDSITTTVILQSPWWDEGNTKAFWEGSQNCSGFPLRQRFVLTGKLCHGCFLLQKSKIFLGVTLLCVFSQWLHAQRNFVLWKLIDSMCLEGACDFLTTVSSSVATGPGLGSICACGPLNWAWVWSG